MTTIDFELRGDKELILKLDKSAREIKNLKPAMDDVGQFLTDFYAGAVFASRGRVIGAPWAPLNDRYAAYKARRWPGRPPLVQTGEMLRSFKSRSTISSALIFNTARHFPYHQLGTGRLPARVMMALDEARARKIGNIISTYINRQLERTL